MFIIGVLLWIGETWYFGWHYEPMSDAEKVLDNLAQTLMIVMIVGIVAVLFIDWQRRRTWIKFLMLGTERTFSAVDISGSKTITDRMNGATDIADLMLEETEKRF
jgi:hypothetical protein